MLAVDERPEPQRIEIELTSHAPAQDRSRGGNRFRRADPVAAASSDEDPPPPRSASDDRRRLVVTGLGAGAVALFLGWSLGRAGSDSDVATTGSSVPTASAVTTTTAVLVGESLPAPLFTIPRTTVPRPSTTTTTVVATEQHLIDPALVGLGVRIVGVEATGDLVEIDLDSGQLTRVDIEGRGRSPKGLIVGTEQTMILDLESGSTVTVNGDRSVQSGVNLFNSGQVIVTPGSDNMWQIVNGFGSGTNLLARQIDFNGLATGVEMTLPGYAVAGDPAGGVVVGLPGGAFSVRPDGAERLTIGTLVGLNRDRIVSVRCETISECNLYETDRTTSAERVVPFMMPSPDSVQSATGWWGAAPETISPDNQAAVIVYSTGPPEFAYQLAIVELDSGELTTLTTNFETPSVVWSPDGRFAFYVQTGNLMALDRKTHKQIRIADVGGLSAIGVRRSPTE
jgi:hypothetical protein